MHYHLVFGSANGPVLAQAFYSDYEESIVDFVEMAQALFVDCVESPDALSFQAAVEITDYGEGYNAVAGTECLCILWMKCDNCRPPQLN